MNRLNPAIVTKDLGGRYSSETKLLYLTVKSRLIAILKKIKKLQKYVKDL
jgi:hypothetical protein